MITSSKAVVIPRAVAIRMGDPGIDINAIPASIVGLVINQSSSQPGVKSVITVTRKTTSLAVVRVPILYNSQSHGTDHGKDQSQGFL